MQHLQGRVIGHQMVDRPEHQPPLALTIKGDEHPMQRGLAHIQPVTARIKVRPKLLGHIALLKVQLLDRQPRLALNHLHRLGQPLPQDPRAQNVVAINHLL